jgi:hypothetical protein
MNARRLICGLVVGAVCTAMGSFAGAASAAPNWTVEGKALGAAESKTVEVEQITEAPTFEVPSLGIDYKCTSFTLTNGNIEGEKLDSAEKITLSGCEVESAPTTCQLKGVTNPDPVGTISTGHVTSELKTVGTTAYDLYSLSFKLKIEPKTGKSCAVAGEYVIKGTLASSLPASGASSTSNSISFSKAIQEAAGAELMYGAKPFFLKAQFDLKLATDQKWGVDWSLAVPSLNWTVEKTGGAVVIPGAAESFPIEIAEVTEAATFEVPGLGINVKCTSGPAATGMKIEGEKKDSIEKLTFALCEVESAPASCQVKGTTFADPVGTITMGKIATELKTVGSTAYDFYAPVTSSFTKIKFEAKTGKSCAIAGEYELKGSFASSLPTAGSLALSQTASFSKAIQEASGASLTFGAKPIFLKFILDLKQSSGLKFGVDW